MAREKLQEMPKRTADEEGVELNAFQGFSRELRGRFTQFVDREEPCPLLVSITVHKEVDLKRPANCRTKTPVHLNALASQH